MALRRATGLCRCGSRQALTRCCGPFVDGREAAATPEQLMRSRYTAYALGRADYIIETTDPEGPRWESDRDAWLASIRDFTRRFRFGGVVVHDSGHSEDSGFVSFTAVLSTRRDDDASFDEHSTFVRRDGRWLYCAGT